MQKPEKFTKDRIDRIVPPAAGRDYYADEGTPLRLAVTANGTKTFFATATIAGKTQRITLGKYGRLKIEAARKLAAKAVADAAAGVDHIAEKRLHKAATGLTLRQALKEYLAGRRVKGGTLALKESTKDDYLRILREQFADYADKPLTDIDAGVVRKVNTQTARSANALRVLSAVFNWALSAHPDVIKANPVLVLAREKSRYVPPRKTNFVGDAELPAFWQAVQTLEPEDRRLVEFLTLTGCRIGETLALKFSDIDTAAATFILRDTKNRRDAVLPLPVDLGAGEGLVFTCNPRTALERLSAAFGRHLTAHDLRRTFASTAVTCELSEFTVKTLLNHTQAGDVTAGYVQRDMPRLQAASARIKAAITGRQALRLVA